MSCECARCREHAGELEALQVIAARARRGVDGAHLWDGIEGRVDAAPRWGSRRWVALSGVAAAALVFVLLSVSFGESARTTPLLLDDAEATAIAQELSAIERRLRVLLPRVSARLETTQDVATSVLLGQIEYLDSNIEACQRIAVGNVMNRQVQDSLLRTTRRKVEVVEQLLAGG